MSDKNKKIDFLILIGYVALIYITLPVAPLFSSSMLKVLNRSQLGVLMNALVMSIIIYAFFLFYRKARQYGLAACLGFAAVLAVYAAILYYTTIPAEKIHLLEYGFLSYLALRLVRDAPGRLARYAYAILIVIVVGCLDEIIQKLLPNRVGEIRDALLNIVSGLLGLAIMYISGYESGICRRRDR